MLNIEESGQECMCSPYSFIKDCNFFCALSQCVSILMIACIQARERKLQKPMRQMEFLLPVSGEAWMSVCLFNSTSGRNWTVLALKHQVASAHYLSVACARSS